MDVKNEQSGSSLDQTYEEVRAALAQRAAANEAHGPSSAPMGEQQAAGGRRTTAVLAAIVAAAILSFGVFFLLGRSAVSSGGASIGLSATSGASASANAGTSGGSSSAADASSGDTALVAQGTGSSVSTEMGQAASEAMQGQAASGTVDPSTGSSAASSSSGAANESAAEVEPAPATPPSIDIANADTLHAVNLFLSNFTEKGALMNGYTYEGATNEQVANFAAAHIYMNNPDAIHYGPGYPDHISWEAPEDVFLGYPKTFLKRDLQLNSLMQIEGTGYSSFEAFINLNPDWVPTTPLGIAYATSSEDAGDGRSRISFDIYWNDESYVVTDESYYTCTAEELMARLGVSGPVDSGVAVVEPYDDGTVAPFFLWSYDSSR